MENVGNHNIIEANFTLNEHYGIAMGDERFYRMMGDKRLYTYDMLVHPDDRDIFFKCIQSGELNNGVILRCLVEDNTYRSMIFTKRSVSVDSNRKCLYNCQVQDIFVTSDRFNYYFANIRKYRALMNMINEKIFEYDYNTGIITIYCYMNNRSEIIDRDNLDEWEKKIKRLSFVEPSQMEHFVTLCENIRTGTQTFSITFRSSLMSKGERFDLLQFTGQTIYDGNERGITTGLISERGARMSDVNVLLEATNINLDSATGVLNKKAITDQVTALINLANAGNGNKDMYLSIWDIDDFKMVNDTYGHYFGDEVIKSFARTLNDVIGSKGLVGRIGGDEFLVFLNDVASAEEVKQILTEVRISLKAALAYKEGYSFSTSIGISQYSKDGNDYETLFKIADGALYIAKEKGKDRYIMYEEEKHGDLLASYYGNRKKFAGVDFMSQIDKIDMASDLIVKTVEGTKEVIPEVLAELMDKMNIHGISVFMGSDMHCVYKKGHYETEPEKAEYVLEEHYLSRFNEHSINVVNNINNIREKYPKLVEALAKNNICSALQFIFYDNKEVAVMIEMDIFGETKRKWSQDDISTIYIVIKAISDAFTKTR